MGKWGAALLPGARTVSPAAHCLVLSKLDCVLICLSADLKGCGLERILALLKLLLFCCFEVVSHSVARAGLDLTAPFLLPSPECWDHIGVHHHAQNFGRGSLSFFFFLSF